jgi:hypothetical protein
LRIGLLRSDFGEIARAVADGLDRHACALEQRYEK